MRLVLLVMACRGEFIDDEERFFGRRRFFLAAMPDLSVVRRRRKEGKGKGQAV